jgi:hypothetical protein
MSEGLKKSILFHITIIILFGVKVFFFESSEPIQYQSAVRVDIVGLPEKATEEVIQPQKPAPIFEKINANQAKPAKPKKADSIDLSKKKVVKLESIPRITKVLDKVISNPTNFVNLQPHDNIFQE